MPTVMELGQLANEVYKTTIPNTVGDWALRDRIMATSGTGLQAAAFMRGSQTVIAFKGTDSAKDVRTDLKLGVGMNTDYYPVAGQFAEANGTGEKTILCGHSLGGAICQVVANRLGFQFITFNAPGVGVVASREILEASPVMTGIRVAGAIASAVTDPKQTLQDIKATFHQVRGVNLCLDFDAVSSMGLHYGRTIVLNGNGINPLTQHGMENFLEVLKASHYGDRQFSSLI